MNILIFVAALLMLAASLTYARLKLFFSSHMQAKQLVYLMQKDERYHYNESALKCQKKRPAPQSSHKTSDTPSLAKPGFGKIYTGWLLDKSFRMSQGELSPLMMDLIKNLMRHMYASQPFYKALEQERPNFLDQLVSEIHLLSEKNRSQVKKLNDLLQVPWNDQELRNAYAHMMQEGLRYKPLQHRSFNDEEEDEEPLEPFGGARSSFQSLNDYFVEKTVIKIRVYLAPRELLLAIYQDEALVDKIIQVRENLYFEAKKGSSNQPFSERFENEFGSQSAFKPLLDFTVTKTDPRGR